VIERFLDRLKNLKKHLVCSDLKRVGVMNWKKAPEELVEFLAQKMKSVNCEYR
jgi:hypothetical protein